MLRRLLYHNDSPGGGEVNGGGSENQDNETSNTENNETAKTEEGSDEPEPTADEIKEIDADLPPVPEDLEGDVHSDPLDQE